MVRETEVVEDMMEMVEEEEAGEVTEVEDEAEVVEDTEEEVMVEEDTEDAEVEEEETTLSEDEVEEVWETEETIIVTEEVIEVITVVNVVIIEVIIVEIVQTELIIVEIVQTEVLITTERRRIMITGGRSTTRMETGSLSPRTRCQAHPPRLQSSTTPAHHLHLNPSLRDKIRGQGSQRRTTAHHHQPPSLTQPLLTTLKIVKTPTTLQIATIRRWSWRRK